MSMHTEMAAAADRLLTELRAAGLTIENATWKVSVSEFDDGSSASMSLKVWLSDARALGAPLAQAGAPKEIASSFNDCGTIATPAPPMEITLPSSAADMATREADAKVAGEVGIPTLKAEPARATKTPQQHESTWITGPLTDDERDIVRTMLDAGATGKDIAARLNRDPRQLGGVIASLRRAQQKQVLTPPAAPPAPKRAPAPAKPAARDEQTAPPAGPARDFDDTGTIPHRLRAVRERLDALDGDDGWTAHRDLALVSALFFGRGLDAAAQACGRSRDNARARFGALCPDNSIETQVVVFNELKRRCGINEAPA